MDTKQIIINFIDILLRVPSLFILDEVFQSSLADLGLYPCSLLPLHKEADFDDVVGDSNHTLSRPLHSVANYDIGVFGNLSQSLIKVIEFDGSSLSLFNIDIAVCQGLLGSILQLALLLSGKFTTFTSTNSVNSILILFSSNMCRVVYIDIMDETSCENLRISFLLVAGDCQLSF
jgi:hypothetical protein